MSRNAEDCENSGSLPQLESEPEVEQIGEAPEDVPFEIPKKWKWVRLSSVQFLIRGITFPASAKHKEPKVGLIRCLTTGSVQQTHRPVSDVYVKSEYVKNNKQYLRRGDVVLSSANSRELVGKNIIWSCDASNVSFGGFLTVARSRTDVLASEFAYVVYQYLFVSGKFMEIATQTTNIANISNKVLAEIALPVPPLAEQRRIVARVNKLLPLVDDFGEAQEAFEVAQTEFPGKLKASLLQAAIEGKLVPQLESEPEVKQIGGAPEEVPFEIPKKWKWIPLSLLGRLQTGTTPSKSHTDYFGGSIPFIKPAQISNQTICCKGETLTDKGASVGRVAPTGSVLMVCIGSIGKCGIVDRLVSFNQQINAVTPNERLVIGRYLLLAMASPYFYQQAWNQASATTISILNKRKWGEIIIPLPPIGEQRRIVARLNKLLASINQLGD